MSTFRDYLRHHFDLTADMAPPASIRESIVAGMNTRGSNLWVLIFAIGVASVGLNVNSPAVIIGAMLISPLMGPIVAIGYGAATTDLVLVRQGARTLLLAAVISLLTSALYFRLTPLTEPGSELLARTTPTVWDVLIALFGGLAGAVGITRREKGNVVPGVAIATALMPPLCTAGYGLATGHVDYLLGALYLFCINSVYISLAAFLVMRFLRLPGPAFADPQRGGVVKRLTWVIAIVTALPSVWLGYELVRKAVYESNVRHFLSEQLTLPATYVVAQRVAPAQRTINVLLAGRRLSAQRLDSIRRQLPRYHLATTRLIIRQGMALYDSADARALRQALLADVDHRSTQALAAQEARLNALQKALESRPPAPALPPVADLLREARVEHPHLSRLAAAPLIRPAVDSLRADTVLSVAITADAAVPAAERTRLTEWLRVRTHFRQVSLLVDERRPAGEAAPSPRSRKGRRR